MTGNSLATATIWSYGLTLVFYAAFAARMALGWRRSPRSILLAAAVVATIAWSAACIGVVVAPPRAAILAASITNALRYAAWFAFLAHLLGGSAADRTSARAARGWTIAAIVAALLMGVALSDGFTFAAAMGIPPRGEFALYLGLAVAGLVLVEQLYRRAQDQARWAIKPLCLALAGIFGYELFFYADAMLFGHLDADIWVARGVATALVVPFIAIATARNVGWTIEMHVSRGAVFHSTAILVSGIFLLVVAATGYLVRFVGGDWGRALSIELVFAGVLFGLVVAMSGRFRSRLKVFVSKHFFSYRYDYREEWLRFTRTLSSDGSGRNVGERTIIALADLVESPAGMLWLKEEDGRHVPFARWNMHAANPVEPSDSPLIRFLSRTGWVVNIPDYSADPSAYSDLKLPAWLDGLADAWLIIPLNTGSDMVGFVVLGASRALIEVDWEVRDLLKTASRQAASYLGQIRATEALLEARKFDAFNRMSAFVVHDLKNLVAQLSLMLRNAERHRDNPEFQRDMLMTVENVVGRMNGLMLQLRTGTTPVDKPRPVDLTAVVKRVCAAKQGDTTAIDLALSPVSAVGHEDRLEHVIAHLVQNALDATAQHGAVAVRVSRDGESAVVEVRDTGAGMSPEFLRDRLFKPFETTKTAGMGIGVYESAQYLKTLGGEIRVESVLEAGTCVRVLLPYGDGADGTTLREAAA